jgi:hypothetical protein
MAARNVILGLAVVFGRSYRRVCFGKREVAVAWERRAEAQR